METDLIIKRDKFLEESEYLKEVHTITNNTLIDLLKRVGISSKDLHSLEFINKYLVGKDTNLAYEDFTRKLEIYRAYGIRLLIVETTPEHTRLLIPIREPTYSKSVGEVGDINYIPSTIDFIRDYQPISGYKKNGN